MKKRILFVDDEPQILEGLQNRLRRLRTKWEMSFVGSGREALKVLNNESIDVIVSDMRMPEMDGATLLTKVQDEYPNVARIVLSGHSELESALRTVPVAHQFLTKPCDAGILENIVERACNLQALLKDEAVRSIVGGIKNLPPLPRVYTQLTAALTDENTSVEEVSMILLQDPALCAKLLQIVNSAFFRLARTVTQVKEAVSYLGFNSIRQLTMAAELFQSIHAQRTPIPLESLQYHAMLVGGLSAQLVESKMMKEDAFVVGLLHDIGKLILVTEMPKHVDKVLNIMEKQDYSMHCAEISLCGVSHAEIGGYLLGLWGLPYPIVEAVSNHHEPTRVNAKEVGILAVIHIADALVHEETESCAGNLTKSDKNLDHEYVKQLGLTDKLPEWRELAKKLLATSNK